jgi:hypothetical protein
MFVAPKNVQNRIFDTYICIAKISAWSIYNKSWEQFATEIIL